MKLKLQKWVVNDLELHNTKEEFQMDENSSSYKLVLNSSFSVDESNSFNVRFRINVLDSKFELFIEAVFTFISDEVITDDFKKSDFPTINAPAIAFPFLRAYISNLTLQSGYKPVILDSINFAKLGKE